MFRKEEGDMRGSCLRCYGEATMVNKFAHGNNMKKMVARVRKLQVVFLLQLSHLRPNTDLFWPRPFMPRFWNRDRI